MFLQNLYQNFVTGLDDSNREMFVKKSIRMSRTCSMLDSSVLWMKRYMWALPSSVKIYTNPFSTVTSYLAIACLHIGAKASTLLIKTSDSYLWLAQSSLIWIKVTTVLITSSKFSFGAARTSKQLCRYGFAARLANVVSSSPNSTHAVNTSSEFYVMGIVFK